VRQEATHRGEPHQWTPLARALAAAGDRWTLAIAQQLAESPLRRAALQARLPHISAGGLDRQLRRMVASRLVTRQRFREMPPRVEYSLTRSGYELLPIAAQLGRWGMRWAWSAPEPHEQVDIGYLLHLLSSLLEGSELPSGAIETVVERPAAPAARYVLRFGDGRHSRAAGSAVGWARLLGTPDAWVAALGPARDLEALTVLGDESLARRVLEALPRSP
jgi:DNA-binding HxlR family transcriptional regulator